MLEGKFKEPSIQMLKLIIDNGLNLEIKEAFEEDTCRIRKHYRSARFDDNCIDLVHGTISNFYYERMNLDG